MRLCTITIIALVLAIGCRRHELPPLAQAAPEFVPVVRTLDITENSPPQPIEPPAQLPADDPPPPDPHPASTILIDEAAIEAALPQGGWTEPASPPPRRVQILAIVMRACSPCEAFKKDFIAWATAAGWIVSEEEAAHVRLMVATDGNGVGEQYGVSEVPVFILLIDGEEAWRVNGYPGRDALLKRYIDAVKSLPPLMKSAEPDPVVVASVVDPALVNFIMKLFGSKPGRLQLVNDEYHFKQDSTSLDVPPQVAGDYTIKSGVKRIAFDNGKRPHCSWRFLSSSVDAATLQGTVLTLELPGLPDVSIDLLK